MRSFNEDLILIAAEFDNVEKRKEVDLELGDYMAGVIMERQDVETGHPLPSILVTGDIYIYIW